MRCRIILILLFSFFSSIAGAADVKHSSPGLLSELLSSFSTYQARFKQVTYDINSRVIGRSNGRIYMQRPGRFRWETKSPTQEIVVTDGKYLWVYNVALAQATQQLLRQRVNINPAALLSGSVKDLNEQFKITRTEFADGLVFFLTPRQPDAVAYKQIQVRFIKENNKRQLVSVRVTNNLGETNVFEFSNIVTDKKLPASLFKFVPPPGVDLVKQ